MLAHPNFAPLRALVAAIVLVVLCPWGPTEAHAQQDDDGLRQNYYSPTLRADAWSLSSNPANLAFVNGVNTAFGVEDRTESDERPSFGWLTAMGTGGGLGMGIGSEWVDAPSPYTRLSLGFAAGGPRAAFGLAFRRYYSDAGEPSLDGFRTMDLGLTLRPANVLGISGQVRDLTTPRLHGVPVERRFVTGLGLRTPDGRVSLDSAYDFAGDRAGEGVITGALNARVVDGWELFASSRVPVDARASQDAWSWTAGVLMRAGGSTTGLGVVGNDPDNTLGRPSFTAVTTVEYAFPYGPQMLSSPRTLLRIDLAGDLPELPSRGFLGGTGQGVTDLLLTLHRVANEDEMGGVYVALGGITAGGAQLEEIRDALEAVKESGKTVIAYLESGTVRDLYIAGVADYVIAAPTLSILDAGLSTRRTYLASFLANLRLEAQFVRIADYKSSPERFIQDGPSPEANEQLTEFLDGVWDEFTRGIGEHAALDRSDVDALLALPPLLPASLEEAGIVDAIGYRNEIPEILREEFGRNMQVSRTYGVYDELSPYWFPPSRVAILHVDGAIVGESGLSDLLFGRVTGASEFVAAADQLRRDPSIDAVLLRIDSPGGSALASDEMQHALVRLAEAKPMVICMGDIAASGGYYVAAIDAPIYASRTTMTGSIGIYAGTLALDDLLQWAGINVVREDRGGPSNFFSGDRWDADDEAAIYRSIEASYEIFVEKVSEARNMERDEVIEVAGGRVWLGEVAAGNGLVDEMGGFLGAWEALLDEADIDPMSEIEVVHYPRTGWLDLPPLASSLARVMRLEREDPLIQAMRDALSGSVVTEAFTALSTMRGQSMARVEWLGLDL